MAVSVIPTLDLERAIAEQGYDVIVGFDEVGRGSLAGPVMVGAAAIWARDLDGAAGASQGGSQESSPLEVPKGVADSKMLTEHRREAIFDELRDWCAAYAVGQASNAEIDEWGITYALGVAALRALSQVERELGLRLGGESTIKKGFGGVCGEDCGRSSGRLRRRIHWKLRGKRSRSAQSRRNSRRAERLHHQGAQHVRRAGRADSSRHNDQSQRRPALRHRRHRGGHRQSDPRPADGRPRAKQPTLRRLRMGS